MEAYILDVTDADFQQKVVEQSYSKLVIVDFWAEWCGPCRVLKPILEKLANEYGGAFILAKVNTEVNQQVAQVLGVQGIPDVKFFKDGGVIDGFVGAQPEPNIRKLIQKYVSSKEDDFLKSIQKLGREKPQDALKKLEASDIPDSGKTSLLKAQLLISMKRPNDARTVLEGISPADDAFEVGQKFLAMAQLMEAEETCQESPLCPFISEAVQAYESGNYTAALDALLEILYRDLHFQDDLARKAFLAIEPFIEPQDIRRRYQRRLSMAVNV